ncbi:hypothetical protein DBR11_09455 [Pedobacter sp. HMWF019]|uniref:ChaN family lipoprotein n=1 Tax=Pedobacter sp. HMWF019 TaxID=2056856 RepID=UPI000D35B90A|nr:ChaN family lipoprotein [Pedobacter sp. HMWF019]PTT00637.1 hypothetical protein DBR11_09455 [Pedobacter sp. HMWF019]
MKPMFLLILTICLPGLLIAQNMEQHYKVYDTKKQKTISLEEIVNELKNVDVLFFGEEHNDSTGHFLEMMIFRKMQQSYPKTALTMEMFHTDVQPVINEYLAGCISEKNFIKEARAWNNYEDYKPLIEYAKANKLNVVGGNAAARYSNMVTRGGLESLKSLPASSIAFLPPLKIDTATGRYYEKFTETLGGHAMGGMKIYQTQNFWDATMAWSIDKFLQKNKGYKVLQLNGRFHSDEKLGTMAQLKTMNAKLRTENISCFSSDDFGNPDWIKYKDLGDYIILTDPGLKRTF